MKKNKNEELNVVFLLDRSGSMAGLEDDTIGGYNSYLEKEKNKNIKVTTILFDDKYEILNNQEDIKTLKPLTKRDYYVRGCTALLDAIGKTITTLETSSPKKVLFIITTDGLENTSKNYTKEQIKEMITGHKDWQFMYIGANIDSYSEGSKIGIEKSKIANYQKDTQGVHKLFKAISVASECVLNEQSLNQDWKKDLN